ncbi:uncharacterized protein LOC117117453 [Anneissia japonica]|uniref:uncharacterized protein LOC117117453 n=1 Tax=Anneissia japonica TaxID=1529436 RepID=UPI001425645D|nr:uncharacterized protein LOC117117453 [Anneissia japonica]
MGERESVEDSDATSSIRNFSRKRRVIIFGDTRVGKTALLNNLMGLPDCCDTVPTDGVNTTFCEVTSKCSTWSLQKQHFGKFKPYETCIPPPTVIAQCSRLIAKDFLKDSLDFYTSVCVIPFYIWIGLLNIGIGALFLAVLFTFQLFVFILRRKHSFQSIPRILDATLFLTFVNILLSSKDVEVHEVAKLDRLFVPRLIVLTIICIVVAQFQCRFGITLALSFFQFSQTRHSEFMDVSCYKSGLRFITSSICICVFIFIIRWRTFNLKISTATVAMCLVLLTLISYFELLAYPLIFFLASISVTFTTILTIHIARCCGAKSYSEVSAIRPKFQCIGIVIGVITAYVFGLGNIVPRCYHSCIEISFNVVMVIVHYCSIDWSIIDRPDPDIPPKVERTIDSFQLTVFEFSNEVQFGNLFHDFITRGDVYMLVFKLNRDVQLEKQCQILLKRLRAYKIKGQNCRQKSLLLVGTHKVEVTQCYMDSLSKLLRDQIDSSEWNVMAGRNTVEQILYAVDNTDMQSMQFDDIRRGLWARLISQKHKQNVSMMYTNVRGESVQLCEGKVNILQENGSQSSSEVDVGDLLNTVVCLFTDTYVSKSEDLGTWMVGKDRLQSICDLAPNLLKTLQDIDLIVYKPTEELYLVPSLLPAYSRNINEIWCRADGDAEFYLAFGRVFHRAVLHLLVLYFVETMNITSNKPVVFSNIALLCVEDINFLLEMITIPDKNQHFIRISIRDSSKNPLYLNILHLILNRLKLICRHIFPDLDYSCGIACPKSGSDFHLLPIASRDQQLSSDTDLTIHRECCDRIHIWLPKRNRVTTYLDARKLTFRDWPQAVVTLVCNALNKYSATGSNWLGLAGKLDFTVDFVENIEDEKNKTLAVLHHWVYTSMTPPLLSDLIDVLQSMERRDIVADINSYLRSNSE